LWLAFEWERNETANRSAKHQPVTIDGTSGTCTPTPAKIKLNELEDVRREMARVYREARGGKIDSSEPDVLPTFSAVLEN
jgi:hypothetical protein